MRATTAVLAAGLAMGLAAGLAVVLAGPVGAAEPPSDDGAWTVYVTNDNCPDYTWGLTETQTRRAFADVVRGHLDEMTRTDAESPESRNRYNMAVTQEALCFVEHYPDRRDELVRRIREGRVYVSPFLCNNLWAFQSVEGLVRTLYPARRLEREWGLPNTGVAEHMEQPNLPWGAASVLAAAGIRWVSVPFLAYDTALGRATVPPLFVYEGPDGARVRVVLDVWASTRRNYTQGAHLLAKPEEVLAKELLPHYRGLGEAYGVRAVLASGTHGDINPGSGGQARRFAETVVQYNRRRGDGPAIVNATLPQFCGAVDEAEARRPFLRPVRGCLGHSWDLWPVCMATYAADMREGERQFLAAEALVAVAARARPDLATDTEADRRRAEWCWAMLADHAWNGTDDRNRRVNGDLRRRWSEDLLRLARDLQTRGWAGPGLAPGDGWVTVFNGLSLLRRGLVRVENVKDAVAEGDRGALPSQVVTEDGRPVLYFVTPEVAGFGLARFAIKSAGAGGAAPRRIRAAGTELDGPLYRLIVDPGTGGIASLIHKPTGAELVIPSEKGRTLGQTVYFDGAEHAPADVTCEAVAEGPVLGRLRIRASSGAARLDGLITLYADLDRVDLDLRVTKPAGTKEERLCHVFPILAKGAVLRVETTGAVLRPRPQPEGDLLPGADPRRLAVQGFLDASVPGGPGVTLATLDAFALRQDLDAVTIEALGNDQNYKEVVRDQHGQTQFRFRYAVRGHAGDYRQAEAVAWSRDAASPMLATLGRLPPGPHDRPPVAVDPRRAIALCLKPADGDAAGAAVLRLWETAGRGDPIVVDAPGYRSAVRVDLVERDAGPLPVEGGKVAVDVRPHGFAAVRLVPGPGESLQSERRGVR